MLSIVNTQQTYRQIHYKNCSLNRTKQNGKDFFLIYIKKKHLKQMHKNL